jgi:hypothetical protein
MSQEARSEYLLIFRGTDWHKGLSLEEMQQVASQAMAWFKRLTEQGIAVGGHPLASEGRVISGKNGRVVADGPFAESKEAIGGYVLVKADSLEEAVAVASHFPPMLHGAQVEIRPTLLECPLHQAAQCEPELASAVA